jgi:hypothetical protein
VPQKGDFPSLSRCAELICTAPCTVLYCRLFVERGGVELLLTLYRLPRLPPTFGSTNASHRWVLLVPA